jgi:uncharacterized protein DUF2252
LPTTFDLEKDLFKEAQREDAASTGMKFAARLVVAIAAVLSGGLSASAQLRPDPESLALASPALVERLQADLFTYFRFVNRPWIARVCEVFADDVRELPHVRLHGDAHLEQFAFTNDAWGLDDFDDSGRGPALIDIVRFLGSVDLATRARRWTDSRDALADRFFEGYRRGLSDPTYQSPEPDLVRALRARRGRSRTAFLAWGETLMEPMDDESVKAVVAGMDTFAHFVHRARPELPEAYFAVSHAGWLRLGVGSAVTTKVLIRVRGASPDPDDDVLIEAKEAKYLDDLRCLEPQASQRSLRIIAGSRQIGRLKHNILAAGPDFLIADAAAGGRKVRDWWIRSWDPFYQEIGVSDLRSVDDLSAVVYDAGVQLGEGSLQKDAEPEGSAVRKQALDTIARLETRIRKETSRLVEELVLGWEELKSRPR